MSLHAHLDYEAAEILIIGSSLYAGIMVRSDSVYSLPVTAIVTIKEKDYILVKEGSELKSVEVILGNRFKDFVEIKNFDQLLNKDIVAEEAYYLLKE